MFKVKAFDVHDFQPACGGQYRKTASIIPATTTIRPPSRVISRCSTSSRRCSARAISARSAHLEEQAQCILVIIGATPEGKKELSALPMACARAHNRGVNCCSISSARLTTAPQIAVADGALGFWKALGEVWPTTREQRCWVHKTANVLNRLPKSYIPRPTGVTGDLDGRDKEGCRDRIRSLRRNLRSRNRWAAECLTKDRDTLLGVLRFPRRTLEAPATTNPIESTFATVRHRTIRSKGCLSNKTALAMVFKLVEAAQEKLAQARWPQPVAQAHPRCQVHRRDRSRRQPASSQSQTAAA